MFGDDDFAYPRAERRRRDLSAQGLGVRGLSLLHLCFVDLGGSETFRRLSAGYGGLVLAEGSLPAEDYTRMVGDGLLDLTGFARPFIANPDYLRRLKEGRPLSKIDPETVYSAGAAGYTDYPFWNADDPAASVVGPEAVQDPNLLLTR